ncbi:superoxide dismutase [Aspergillus egyptiacus]|nr:superoxide dismutase [Aspergillus egyptiacus]
MYFKVFTGAFLGLVLAVSAQDSSTHAPVITNNMPISLYRATLLQKDNTTVYGGIFIGSQGSESASQIDIFLGGIPEGEHLNYHIHQYPVPENGNCYQTGAHLDPYGRGQTPPCDITAPHTCEVGDISGKHGPAFAPPGEVFSASFPDFFLSNNDDKPAFFGNRSFVVHGSGGERLTCGNFEEVDISND